nr:aminotransferase class I/II-fold pyridoxal phosphate-dependent enzyme [Rhodothermus marinus]
MAAATALLQALEPGSHVLIPDDVYYGVRNLLENVFTSQGLHYSTANFTDLEAVRAALHPNTRLIWAETPSNPLLKITDLAGLAHLAREAEARLVVDSTWAPPPIQRPLDLGADLVLHSLTKYLSGHSDVMGGALIAREADDFFARIRMIQQTAGAVLDHSAPG